jgi:hypothetical protein
MHDMEQLPGPAMASPAPTVATSRRRRWVKLAVDEALFEHLHIAAAKSGLRITPYFAEAFSKGRAVSEGVRPLIMTRSLTDEARFLG